MATKFTGNTFEQEVLQSDKPVLVDFYADWCGPCKMMAPVVDQLAEELGDTIKIGKINIDDDEETALKYKVMSVPTFALFKDGNLVKTLTGAMPKQALIDFINS